MVNLKSFTAGSYLVLFIACLIPAAGAQQADNQERENFAQMRIVCSP